jgi:YD repeat-containing protein
VFHTSYAYDPVRQITSVTDDQGNVTTVAYDLFGRRTAINNPDAGLGGSARGTATKPIPNARRLGKRFTESAENRAADRLLLVRR